jgi:hypothetical protein
LAQFEEYELHHIDEEFFVWASASQFTEESEIELYLFSSYIEAYVQQALPPPIPGEIFSFSAPH